MLAHAIQLLITGQIGDPGTIETRRRTHHGRRHRHWLAHWATIVEGSHDSEVLGAARWGGKRDNCVSKNGVKEWRIGSCQQALLAMMIECRIVAWGGEAFHRYTGALAQVSSIESNPREIWNDIQPWVKCALRVGRWRGTIEGERICRFGPDFEVNGRLSAGSRAFAKRRIGNPHARVSFFDVYSVRVSFERPINVQTATMLRSSSKVVMNLGYQLYGEERRVELKMRSGHQEIQCWTFFFSSTL